MWLYVDWQSNNTVQRSRLSLDGSLAASNTDSMSHSQPARSVLFSCHTHSQQGLSSSHVTLTASKVCPLLMSTIFSCVPERVAYKLAVTFHRCLHGLAPSYLAQSVRRVAELDRRRLRSLSSDDVIIPTTRLVTVGDRAFTAAGSRLWNSLPPDIRSAQTLPVLKTYLFSKCFPL